MREDLKGWLEHSLEFYKEYENMKKHCCEDMEYHVNFKCNLHDNSFDCPDKLIIYDLSSDDYGLIIHDGGSSSIRIDFCPWCASKLKFNEE